ARAPASARCGHAASRIHLQWRGTSDKLADKTHSARTRPALRIPLSSCAFCGDDQRTSGIERAPEPGHERADTFAVGAEVTDRTAQRPRRALERERHFVSGERAAQPLQAIDARITGPANRAGGRGCRDPFVAELVLQQIEELIACGGHA